MMQYIPLYNIIKLYLNVGITCLKMMNLKDILVKEMNKCHERNQHFLSGFQVQSMRRTSSPPFSTEVAKILQLDKSWAQAILFALLTEHCNKMIPSDVMFYPEISHCLTLLLILYQRSFFFNSRQKLTQTHEIRQQSYNQRDCN